MCTIGANADNESLYRDIVATKTYQLLPCAARSIWMLANRRTIIGWFLDI